MARVGSRVSASRDGRLPPSRVELAEQRLQRRLRVGDDADMRRRPTRFSSVGSMSIWMIVWPGRTFQLSRGVESRLPTARMTSALGHRR